MSPLQVQVKLLPVEKVIPVWEAANAQERQKIYRIVKEKIHGSKTISRDRKRDLLQSINAESALQ